MSESNNSMIWCRNYKGRNFTYEDYVREVEEFHGFGAPGLILGGAMVGLALKSLPEDCVFDAICETKTCLPDAIQILTLCTIGNGWLRVLDYGRFAFTLYDKYSGDGVRIFIDPVKTADFPDLHKWFFRLIPKKEQNFELMMRDIRYAHGSIFGVVKVKVDLAPLKKIKSSQTVICPSCGEAFPSLGRETCGACSGDAYYKAVQRFTVQRLKDEKIKDLSNRSRLL